VKNIFEGKLSNQHPRFGMGGVLCAKCRKQIGRPEITVVQGMPAEPDKKYKPTFLTYSYLTETTDERDYYIYPTTKGSSVCYCSKRCRDVHNHRYHKYKSSYKKTFQSRSI
jgi:hypothetical protein